MLAVHPHNTHDSLRARARLHGHPEAPDILFHADPWGRYLCSADVAAPPTFLMERTYVASVRRFLNATASGDQIRFTIDMRNMFPQAENVRAPLPPP